MKPIRGFEGYFASEDGAIYSKDGIHGRGLKPLKGHLIQDGRRMFCIYDSTGKRRSMYHSKLVAIAFYGNLSKTHSARIIDKTKPVSKENVYWRKYK